MNIFFRVTAIILLSVVSSFAAPLRQEQGGTGNDTVLPAGTVVTSDGRKYFGDTPWVSAVGAGAKCDVAYPTSHTIAAGTNTLSAPSVNFTSADIGKLVLLPGQTATGGVLHTSITGISGTDALLAHTATAGTGKVSMQAAQVTTTRGTGYAPGDTITIAGGTGTVATVLTVETTMVAATPGIVAAGSGGTNGAQQIYGTTGNGNRVVLNVTITAGALASIDSIYDDGHYTSNPTNLSAEPVAGAGLTGATISLVMGVDLLDVTTPGIYTGGLQPTSPASQGSSSGSGTGATFTLAAVFNGQLFVYGTDDSAILNTLLAVSNQTIRLPETSCGIATTLSMPGDRIWLQGKGASRMLPRGARPLGTTLQWLGADGGTMLTAAPPGVLQAQQNRISGINFMCSVQRNLTNGRFVAVADVGLRLVSQANSEFDHLSFASCAAYDIYTTAAEATGDFIHNYLHDIYLDNGIYNDGIGIFLTGLATGSLWDSDVNRIVSIFGSYANKPLLQIVTLDQNYAGQLHFVRVPGSLMGMYGLDISGGIYGSGEPTVHIQSLFLERLLTSSVVRGLESTSNPPKNIVIIGFDPGNGNLPTVLQPGHGAISYLNVDGSFHLEGPFQINGTVRGNTSFLEKCIVAQNVAAADDNILFSAFQQAVTIKQVWCNYNGVTPTTAGQFALEDGSGAAMTHTVPTCSGPATPATAQAITAGGHLLAREVLRFDVTNTPNPTTDTYQVCVAYVLD